MGESLKRTTKIKTRTQRHLHHLHHHHQTTTTMTTMMMTMVDTKMSWMKTRTTNKCFAHLVYRETATARGSEKLLFPNSYFRHGQRLRNLGCDKHQSMKTFSIFCNNCNPKRLSDFERVSRLRRTIGVSFTSAQVSRAPTFFYLRVIASGPQQRVNRNR